MLTIRLSKKWFDKVLSGEKPEEYRSISDYWSDRYKSAAGMEHMSNREFVSMVRARPIPLVLNYWCGSTENKRQAVVRGKLTVGVGKKEYGAENEDECYVFRIEDVYLSEGKDDSDNLRFYRRYAEKTEEECRENGIDPEEQDSGRFHIDFDRIQDAEPEEDESLEEDLSDVQSGQPEYEEETEEQKEEMAEAVVSRAALTEADETDSTFGRFRNVAAKIIKTALCAAPFIILFAVFTSVLFGKIYIVMKAPSGAEPYVSTDEFIHVNPFVTGLRSGDNAVYLDDGKYKAIHVIAEGGDAVEMYGGYVWVNGNPVAECDAFSEDRNRIKVDEKTYLGIHKDSNGAILIEIIPASSVYGLIY